MKNETKHILIQCLTIQGLKRSTQRSAKLGLSILAATSLSACGMFGYTYEPGFFAKPKYYNAAQVEGIEIPEIPAREIDTIEFNYKTVSEIPTEGSHYTFTDKTRTFSTENSPSIVVVLPRLNSPLEAEHDRSLIENTLAEAGFTVKIDALPDGSISEQLKAAKSHAKYALLVNELSATPRATREFLNLDELPDFQGTLSKLKQTLPSEKHSLINTTIPAPGLQARFSAKIVDLKSGAIVWIGRYTKNSSDIKDFRITYNSEKFTNNDDEILNKVSRFNDKVNAHSQEIGLAKSLYGSTFNAASTPKEFEEEADMLSFAKKVKKEYRHAEERYIHLYEDSLKLPKERENVSANLNWTYDYKLDKPKTSPSIENLSAPPLVSSQSNHMQQLLEAAVVPLLTVFKADQQGEEPAMLVTQAE